MKRRCSGTRPVLRSRKPWLCSGHQTVSLASLGVRRCSGFSWTVMTFSTCRGRLMCDCRAADLSFRRYPRGLQSKCSQPTASTAASDRCLTRQKAWRSSAGEGRRSLTDKAAGSVKAASPRSTVTTNHATKASTPVAERSCVASGLGHRGQHLRAEEDASFLPVPVGDATFHELLLAYDRDFADTARCADCARCSGVDHSAPYWRKPRGRPCRLGREHDRRWRASRRSPAATRMPSTSIGCGMIR
jgi:hypothetical protein